MILWDVVVGGLLKVVPEKIGDYYIAKKAQEHEIKLEQIKGKIAWEQAKTRRAEASDGYDHAWELQSMNLHAGGWKDELVIVVFLTPAIMSFIPGGDVYVKRGFDALGMTPYWYQLVLVSISLAIYGIRYARRQEMKGMIKDPKSHD